MRERPILFSAPMVRAILDGRKTMTRRICKGQRELSNVHDFQLDRCPYGAPGDRLWVRETFMHEPADYCWEASVSIPCRPASTVYRADYPDAQPVGWTPSIHMPRWASRITLEVTGVRVERLCDISEADAKAEGCPCYVCGAPLDGHSESDCHCFHRTATASDYRGLWGQINGAGSWEANPWVWVVAFRRVQP